MKTKIISILTLAAAGLMTSCEMDLPPVGALDETTAIQTVTDAMSYRNVFYTGMRAFTSSDFLAMAELQADCFNGLVINGNRGGALANGDVLSSDGDISGYWSSLFYYINNVNYFVEHVEPLYDKAVEANNEDDVLSYKLMLGEARFFRAYFYSMMFDRWCQQYSDAIADQPGLGLPIVTKYFPTGDRSRYPGRSSMREILDFIYKDFDAAYEAELEYEQSVDGADAPTGMYGPMAYYINPHVIEAMRARLALWVGDYQSAIDFADKVIDSKVYTLTPVAAYAKMWTDDLSNEIIFMPFESSQELGGAYGANWIGSNNNQADYIPTSGVITDLMNGYNSALKRYDVRFTAFVNSRPLSTNFGTINTPCFNKFPGNPELQTSNTPNLVNKPKAFRLAEMYLIKAEASYRLGDATACNAALGTLWASRYSNLKYADKEGSELWTEVMRQRTLELLGEGFRLSDLRRWGLGFVRTHDYANVKMSGINKADIEQILTPAGLDVVYQADDHRYTWPIPSRELEVNPQIRDQQNPGYAK